MVIVPFSRGNFPKLKLEFAPQADAADSTESTDTKVRCTARSLKEEQLFESTVCKCTNPVPVRLRNGNET